MTRGVVAPRDWKEKDVHTWAPRASDFPRYEPKCACHREHSRIAGGNGLASTRCIAWRSVAIKAYAEYKSIPTGLLLVVT